jgi:hypothetical protein
VEAVEAIEVMEVMEVMEIGAVFYTLTCITSFSSSFFGPLGHKHRSLGEPQLSTEIAS